MYGQAILTEGVALSVSLSLSLSLFYTQTSGHLSTCNMQDVNDTNMTPLPVRQLVGGLKTMRTGSDKAYMERIAPAQIQHTTPGQPCSANDERCPACYSGA